MSIDELKAIAFDALELYRKLLKGKIDDETLQQLETLQKFILGLCGLRSLIGLLPSKMLEKELNNYFSK